MYRKTVTIDNYGSPLLKANVRVKFNKKYNRETNDDIDQHVDAVWQKLTNVNSKVFNGSKFRFHSHKLQDQVLTLNFGITGYKDFLGTNLSERKEEFLQMGEKGMAI